MLKNKLYLFDKWLSKDRNTLLVLLLVVSSTLMISYEPTLFYGILLLSIICSYVVFIKAKILGGQLKLDKSVYILPILGEVLVSQKGFKYDLYKVENSRNYINTPSIQYYPKGVEFIVVGIKELEDNWIINLSFTSGIPREIVMDFFWLDVKDYFMTIADIREDKLKKLLK